MLDMVFTIIAEQHVTYDVSLLRQIETASLKELQGSLEGSVAQLQQNLEQRDVDGSKMTLQVQASCRCNLVVTECWKRTLTTFQLYGIIASDSAFCATALQIHGFITLLSCEHVVQNRSEQHVDMWYPFVTKKFLLCRTFRTSCHVNRGAPSSFDRCLQKFISVQNKIWSCVRSRQGNFAFCKICQHLWNSATLISTGVFIFCQW